MTEFIKLDLQAWMRMTYCCDGSTWLDNMGNLCNEHQVGDMEHGSLIQGHYVGALVEVSLMGIQ